MKAEDAKKIADHALEQLTHALKSGKSEQLTQYLAMLAKFHHYSFGNVLMILSQYPEATHVAGFSTWKQLGRFVKKGQRGIVIIAPMSIRPKEDDQPETNPKPILRFRGVHVFDVSQTDGEALPEPVQASGEPGEHLNRLHQLIASHGITLDHDDVPSGADGVSRGGRISIRPGLEPAHAFSVTVHELAHELLHRGEERPTSKVIRETEAEAVAFVVCSAIGLSTSTSSSDYIQLYTGEDNAAEMLAKSLSRIQKTAAEIIEAIQAREPA